jgi:hypothetical protein
LRKGKEQVYFQWDDDEVCFVLDQHAELNFYSSSSLKQQSAVRHVAPHYSDSEPTLEGKGQRLMVKNSQISWYYLIFQHSSCRYIYSVSMVGNDDHFSYNTKSFINNYLVIDTDAD